LSTGDGGKSLREFPTLPMAVRRPALCPLQASR